MFSCELGKCIDSLFNTEVTKRSNGFGTFFTVCAFNSVEDAKKNRIGGCLGRLLEKRNRIKFPDLTCKIRSTVTQRERNAVKRDSRTDVKTVDRASTKGATDQIRRHF